MSAGSTSNAPRVVAGVDGSPSSRAALRWAVRYAALTGGTVDAVMAGQVPETDLIGGFGQTPAEVDDEVVVADDALHALDTIISEEVKPDDRNRVRARVFEGHAAAALLKAADGAELVAVGHRGRSGLAEAVLGSVGHHLARHASCPVLIVRGTEAQGTEGQSRGEQARPYLENASYPARREDLAASAQQQDAGQDLVDLIVVIPDGEYADVDAVIVQIDLADANA